MRNVRVFRVLPAALALALSGMTACTGTGSPPRTVQSAPRSDGASTAPSRTTSGTSAPSGTTTSTPNVSGTSFPCVGCGLFQSEFRTAVEEFGFSDGFDPAGEQWRPAWGLYSELLLRTLMTYRHVAGSAGLVPVPDIADGQPVVSDDGLTFTFHLKPGIRFGPQVSREVTSRDVEYAFERIDTAALGSQSAGSFVGVIEGMTGTAERPTPISGIETPDRSTIVFHLLRPTGDLVHLLGLPATAPVPKEVAGCFDDAGEYGRYLVSTGPYMIASDAAYTRQPCSALRPLSGFGPRTHLELIPNPDYDPATDSPEVRSNNLTDIHIAVEPDAARILDGVRSGDLTGTWATVPPTSVVREYEADPALRPLLHSDMDGTTRYIGMNLLVPPFDDVHVRRAMNLVIDREELLRQWGGPSYGDIATHVLPPVVLPGATLDPGEAPEPSGSLRAAKEEMSRSRYDTDGDGICDAPECKNVIYIPSTLPPLVDIVPSVVRRASAIGVTLKIRDIELGPCDTVLGLVRNLIPIAGCSATVVGGTDPARFAAKFDSSGIRCEGQVNTFELGMTAAQARECDVLEVYRDARPVPSEDRRIAGCEALPPGADRDACWAEFDRVLMTEDVPLIPFIWPSTVTIVTPDVTRYEFDQFSGTISLCHVVVRWPPSG